jgi:formate dehydrogenase iron-sulfur subunit
LLQTLLCASVAKLAFEASIFRHLAGYRVSALKRSAKLMVGPLVRSTMARFGFGIIGGVLLPMMLIDQLNSETTTASMESTSVVVMVGIILVACFTGEILERFQFFAAVASPRMPGNIRR